MSLFSQQTYAPLAARMRPVTLDEYVGQSHLVGPGKPLRKMLESSHCLMLDSQGQQSAINFSEREFNTPIFPSAFIADVPESFMVDDQRP